MLLTMLGVPIARSLSRFHYPPLLTTICLQAFSTEASLDKESVTNEILKEFRATIENAPAASSGKVCCAYIDKICKAGNVSALSQMLQMLNEKNIIVSPNVYNLMLVEAIQNNDIDLSFQLLKKLLLSGESPSATSCIKFAQAFRNVNHSVELLRFLKEIVSQTSGSSISSFINKIIYAFAKSGQKDSALVIFSLLKIQNDSVLDLITYNIVLDILGRKGHVDEMLDVFASLKKAGFVPDTISYNTLIHGLGKVGRSDLCFAYFEEMKENGNQPNLLTYTALIDTFGGAGNIGESLKLFREMKLKGILPSIQIYRSLIHNLTKIEKIELATELLGEMNSSSTVLPGPRDFKTKRRQRKT
ncbi:pentatricopeptide repeat-containing protein At1g11900 [Vicia villosa]|uniref:pentatricopeptide repeat-containing protein At1g11900 n=1 Tax=Vicia villosa TaxID=3911 RepID=UPI00273AB5E2|nr:pentatricopeptide repeat-containing protein At1g11900 [Vicia villosa]